ncbi:MAG: sulfonate ABC transporter substrate-binding protein [Acetobacteraceae bacterium]|nr:sulfonate ABC transporter substrate-binding protein [Acetobacteraceae bacterium]
MHEDPERSTFRIRTRRRRLLLALAAAPLLPLATEPAAAGDKVLRIGVQKYGTLIILRERHVLEQALKPLGWSVSWAEFPGGPQLLEALNVGAIDFGTTGETPPIFAQAAGAPLLYVSSEPPSPRGEAILVPKNSHIRGITDLKGKRVALNKGSNVHYLLVRALESAGLKPGDIQVVYLAPADGRAAFDQGAVDAWVIWDPFLAVAQHATQARALTDARGLAPNRQFFLASRALVQEHSDVIKLVNDQIDETDRWAEQHQPEAAALLSASLGVPQPVMAQALARMGYGVAPLTPEVVADQQKIADTFHALRLIPSPITVSEAVWHPGS